MFRMTKSVDGVSRLNVRITTRLTLVEMADLITAEYGFDFYDYDLDDAVLHKAIKATIKSRTAAVALVKTAVERIGLEVAPYRVGDANLAGVSNSVLAHLKTLWKE